MSGVKKIYVTANACKNRQVGFWYSSLYLQYFCSSMLHLSEGLICVCPLAQQPAQICIRTRDRASRRSLLTQLAHSSASEPETRAGACIGCAPP